MKLVGAALRKFKMPLVRSLAACDPDVIDLRPLGTTGIILRGAIEEAFPGRILASGTDAGCQSLAGSCRRYDPRSLVSIVLPVHNGARFLAESIESCLSQTHRQIELIIVDDCSTDDTATIISFYEKQDDRLRAFRNEANRGLPETLNVGFSKARGDLLTWTSDDNVYDSEAIAYMAQQLHTYPDVGFVYCGSRLIDESGRVTKVVWNPSPSWLERYNPVGACFMYRREVMEAVGAYRSEYRLVEDYDYWIRIAKLFLVKHCSEVLYSYRSHDRSLTSQHRARWAELIDRLHVEHFSNGAALRAWEPSPGRESSRHNQRVRS
jgi:glycosyltransferase involved in cell wall biosynthesis